MTDKMITIDGSMGEGGGQVLRTSLALSLVTGKSFRIENIRAGRKKPGLLRQHLTAAKAARKISSAEISGLEMGSTELKFMPGKVKGGEYKFSVGSAGSATLVLQTVLPALMLADEPSNITLEGGTHNPWAPPMDFLERAFLPVLGRMGPKVEIELERCGFYPAGGGCFHVSIQPVKKLEKIDILERGQIQKRRAHALVACLSENIGHREIKVVKNKIEMERSDLSVETVESPGPGNALIIEIVCEHVTEIITSFGKRGVSAENVAKEAVKEARAYIASGAPVGPHLADQLLVPMALAGGGSFATCAPTKHTTTNIEVIKRFLDVNIEVNQLDERVWRVDIG